MGLTKTAISKIVTELMENGFLIETKKQENAELGRNPIGLDFAETAPLQIGIASVGPLDIIEGVIEAPPFFHGIHDVPVVSLLK